MAKWLASRQVQINRKRAGRTTTYENVKWAWRWLVGSIQGMWLGGTPNPPKTMQLWSDLGSSQRSQSAFSCCQQTNPSRGSWNPPDQRNATRRPQRLPPSRGFRRRRQKTGFQPCKGRQQGTPHTLVTFQRGHHTCSTAGDVNVSTYIQYRCINCDGTYVGCSSNPSWNANRSKRQRHIHC